MIANLWASLLSRSAFFISTQEECKMNWHDDVIQDSAGNYGQKGGCLD